MNETQKQTVPIEQYTEEQINQQLVELTVNEAIIRNNIGLLVSELLRRAQEKQAQIGQPRPFVHPPKVTLPKLQKVTTGSVNEKGETIGSFYGL